MSRFENDTFRKIRERRPVQPTYQPKMTKYDNFGNFWLIKLKFGIQVPFSHPHAAVTFDDDPTIFSQTNPTHQKVAYSEIFKLL